MSLIALRPTQRVVDIVGALGGTWRGYIATCRCPAHQDSDPSLSVRQGHDGILVHCFAGCDPGDVLREISRLRPSGSHQPPPARHRPGGSNVGRLWEEALPADGTAAAEYLDGRGLRLPLDDNLKWLTQWYLAQCNDDWEHLYGVKIDTLDNPGWSLRIELTGTAMQDLPFERVEYGEPSDDLAEWQRTGSWWVASVQGKAFEVACGPLDLCEAIGVFRRWVEASAVS